MIDANFEFTVFDVIGNNHGSPLLTSKSKTKEVTRCIHGRDNIVLDVERQIVQCEGTAVCVDTSAVPFGYPRSLALSCLIKHEYIDRTGYLLSNKLTPRFGTRSWL